MGDVNSSDSSWKKIVIAKAKNNKWISKSGTAMDDSMDGLEITKIHTDNEEITLTNVDPDFMKTEQSDADIEENYHPEDSLTVVINGVEAGRRQRRRGSQPKNESTIERTMRLAKMSAYSAQRLAKETPEQRAVRLKRMSEYAAKRMANETSEQRAQRLSRMSAYASKRLANESPEQRQARLARMSAYAARRQAMKKGSNMAHCSRNQDPGNFNFINCATSMSNQS